MILVTGEFNQAKVFAETLEPTARAQIKALCDQPFSAGSTIRIMPDVHAGAGCTIGTTMTITDKVVPNLVGVDIGCGMLTVSLFEDTVDFPRLDQVIRRQIPSGFSIRKTPHAFLERVAIDKLRCLRDPKQRLNMERGRLSLGTLGGGNHFIEVNRDEEGRLYLVVHSGSRHLGLQVALHYQQLAAKEHPQLPKDLAWLDGESFEAYLHDMKIMQDYAAWNRQAIADTIVEAMGWRAGDTLTTIHNYIDLKAMILRKGAISAKKDERVLIPLNMRDGSLLCRGRGNRDWNVSAPHGAGRLMSRREAKRRLSLETLRRSMAGIYTTSLRRETLDESPLAYKSLDDLRVHLDETVEVLRHLRPVYNFKASGD